MPNRQSARSTAAGEARSLFFDPVVVGTVCGMVSAVGYTAANVCLRAVSGYDAVWVSCVKSFPTILLVAPWLLVLACRGEKIMPSAKVLAALVLSGAFAHIAGNVAFQWSLGIIGMALAVPLTLGSIIATGAMMGRMFLNEPITLRTAASIAALVAAIFVLSLGAEAAHVSVMTATEVASSQVGFWLLAAGVGAACLAGFAYSVLGVVIRYAVGKRTPVSSTLLTVALVGLTTLGSISLVHPGLQAIMHTSPDDFGVMVLAGLCNTVAFVALTKALQVATIIYVNALNATQAAMAAVAGVIFFQEARSPALLVGVALTIVGLMLMRGRKRRKSYAPENVAAGALPADTLDEIETKAV